MLSFKSSVMKYVSSLLFAVTLVEQRKYNDSYQKTPHLRVTFCRIQPTSDTQMSQIFLVFTYFGPYMVLNFIAVFFLF